MNKKFLISLALLSLLACACAKKSVSTTGSDAQEYLLLWMDKYYPGVAANADGIYILEDTPGTGETWDNEKLYVLVEVTIRGLSGTISATTDENLAKQLGTYEKSNYYGPKYQMMGDGTSYAGNPAYTVYTVSADGKYRALQMEKTFDDRTVMDEYFDLGDAMLFARTTLYNNGEFDPVEKYFITGGTVYKLDYESNTLISVADVDSSSSAQAQTDLDMYFTFDEIVAIYG